MFQKQILIISDSSEKVRIKMRVLLPTGTIMEVAKVVAVCEQRLTYNGRDLRLCEKAADIAYANGIGLFPEAQGSFDVATGNAIMLGNLSNEVVREVLTSLVIKEWVDLSSLKLQKKQLMTTQNSSKRKTVLAHVRHRKTVAKTSIFPAIRLLLVAPG